MNLFIKSYSLGAAFSMFRFSSVQYGQPAPNKGMALGLSIALREVGPALAYWIGPFILVSWGPMISFSASTILSLAFIPFLGFLPVMKTGIQAANILKFQKGNWLDAWVFSSSFLVDGLVIVSFSYLLNFHGNIPTDKVLFITAFFISLHRISQIVLAPISGWFVGKFGYKKTFLCSSVSFLPATILFALNFTQGAVILLFLAEVMNNVALPFFTRNASSSEDNLNTFSRLSTAKDVGGTVGALIGVALVQKLPYPLLFGIILFTLINILSKTHKFVLNHGTI